MIGQESPSPMHPTSHLFKFTIYPSRERVKFGKAISSLLKKLKKIFNDDLGVQNARDMHFMNAHRFGSPKAIFDPATNKTLYIRPLIVRFTSMPDKEKVLGQGTFLR